MEQISKHNKNENDLTLNGIRTIIKSDGKNYSIRDDRRKTFFPEEWDLFINSVKNKQHRFFFITLLHTGARIMEALHLKYKDIDTERNTINFTVVKQRKAKKNYSTIGKSRKFFIASNYVKEYKSFIRGKKINQEDYIFLDNDKLPKDYEQLQNSDRKKYYFSKVVSYSAILKRKLKKTKIKDWHNFSPHNIRKTYGMWMRTFNIEMMELCYRMGHDMDTFMAHYGSSLIYTPDERRHIMKIMGDVK